MDRRVYRKGIDRIFQKFVDVSGSSCCCWIDCIGNDGSSGVIFCGREMVSFVIVGDVFC